MLKCSRITSALFCLSAGLSGQTAPAKPDYSKEPYVIEQVSTQVDFENDGTETRDLKAIVHIQSDAGIQNFAVLTLPYQSSIENLEINYVRVRKPDASVVLTLPDNIQDLASEVTRQAPMYSDLREKHIAVKGLGKGDVLEYGFRSHVTKPLVPGQFWFSYTFPRGGIILKETLQVSVPAGRTIKWSSRKSKPVITESAERRFFTWSNSQTEHLTKEQEEQEAETLVYQAGRGRVPAPEIQLSSFESWEQLGRWYDSLQQDRVKPTPEVRAKAIDLTKGMTDDTAKARALYNYVSEQIHYIGISLGIGRFQPHSAAEVLANQYGDCKDKHTLLAALLAAVNIPAYATLIGSAQELDPQIPAPSQFDHLISAIQLDGHLVWVDTTPEVGSFRYLTGGLRGKQALLVNIDKSPALITTPEETPVKSLQVFRIDATLSDTGTLKGKVIQLAQGNDLELILRAAFRRVPFQKWNELVQQISYNSGFSGDVSDVTASEPEKMDEPVRYSYNYERKDYPDWPNRRINSPLPPIGLPAIDPKNDKVHPIWLGWPSETDFEAHVELPKGYRPTLPKDLNLIQPFAEYRRVYRLKDGVLTSERHMIVKHGDVLPADYEAYKKFSKQIGDDYSSNILLSSGPSSPANYQSEVWELPGTDNPDAARAYDDAREKANREDIQGAIAALKHSIEADPKFVRARLWLGQIYLSQRQNDSAIQQFRKAVEIDPDQAVSYKALGFALMSEQKAEEALSVWRKMAEALPRDSGGIEMQGVSLLMLKRYKEAQTVLESALSLNPESTEIRVQLGGAYLHSGESAKATLVYKKAIELDSKPFLLNNIAYDLAENGGDLTLAFEYARKAVSEEAKHLP